MTHAIRGLLFSALLMISCIVDAAVVGSFTFDRGGFSSFGYYLTTPVGQTYLTQNPDLVLVETDTLTDDFLADIDVLVIGAVVDGSPVTPVTPLSAAEQTAMMAFFLNGGGVVIFADNASVSATSASMLSPFGLAVGGALGGLQTAVVSTTHPITEGITTYSESVPGYFTNMGNATCLAELPNAPAGSRCTLTVFDHGTFANGSGALIATSDYNWHPHLDNQQLFANVVEYAEPLAPLAYIDAISTAVNNVAAVATLAYDSTQEKSVVRFKSLDGQFLKTISFFGATPGWLPKALVLIPDSDGNGVDEIAVLATNILDGRVRVRSKDIDTKQNVSNISYPE